MPVKSRRSATISHALLLATAPLLALHSAAIGQTTQPEPTSQGGTANAGLNLPTVNVQGSPTDGYVTLRSSSATRTDTLLRDTPQSVSVITDQAIRDVSMQNLQDALRYVPGAGFQQGEGNRDTPVLRGNATTAALFADGLRDDVQYYRDFYNLDRLEVLLGPNALSFGRGGAGGVINRVTKQADGISVRELRTQVGSFGDYRGTFDVGQAVNDWLALRMQGLYERSDSYREGVRYKRYGLSPEATIHVDERTVVRLGYENFRDERTADRGIPSFQGVPFNTSRSAFFGDPNRSPVHATVNVLNASIERQMTDALKLRSQFRYGDYGKEYTNIFATGPVSNAGTFPVSGYKNRSLRQNIISQTDALLDVYTGPVRHQLLGGIEYNRQATDNVRETAFFPTLGANVSTVTTSAFNPRISLPIVFRPNATDANNSGVVNTLAGYVQDQMQLLPRVQLIAGVRYEDFDIGFTNNRTGVVINKNDGHVSPRAGLVYNVIDPLSLYVSYATSYLPRAGEQLTSLTLSNAALEPESFQNAEVGAKLDISPGLALTAALYRLNRTNVAVVDPANVTRSILVDGTRVQGLELGIRGRITDRWSVLGGYAFQDSAITSDQSATIRRGNTVPFTPRNTYSLWNRYNAFPETGIGFGLGVIGQTTYFAATDNTVKIPGFARLDAAVFWDINERWQAQLNLENLAQAKYYPVADNNNNITPGAPFSLRFGLTTRF